MNTKADQFRANALHEIHEDYVWGAEGNGGVAGDDNYDCSGFYHAMLRNVDVKESRTTAEGYRLRGKRIDHPSKVGQDFAVLVTNGRAHHIIPFIGKGDTVEAKGKAYGVVFGTVDSANARGAHWYRISKYDIGELTDKVALPSAYKYPGKVLDVGSTGTDVRWVEKAMRLAGYDIPIDGKLSEKDGRAISDFKEKHGRIANPRVGKLTWTLLRW